MEPWRKGNYIPEDCYECAENDVCSFGCREAAKIETGTYSGMEPWATGPLEKKQRKINIQELSEKERLRIIPNLRFRKEKRGYFVFSPRDHSAVYINKEFFKILSFLNQKEGFVINDLKKKYENSNGLFNIIKYLNSRGLVESW